MHDIYQNLTELDPALRKQWLLEQRPAKGKAHWWLVLIDRSAHDVRTQLRDRPTERPSAALALTADLIDWSQHDGFPPAIAVGKLTSVAVTALEAGHDSSELPSGFQPHSIARTALRSFGMTLEDATVRAASLRATVLTEDDFIQPGESLNGRRFQELAQTSDYRDYHCLLDIESMLGDLAPLAMLITDPSLAAELSRWLHARPQLDPDPQVITSSPDAGASLPAGQ